MDFASFKCDCGCQALELSLLNDEDWNDDPYCYVSLTNIASHYPLCLKDRFKYAWHSLKGYLPYPSEVMFRKKALIALRSTLDSIIDTLEKREKNIKDGR